MIKVELEWHSTKTTAPIRDESLKDTLLMFSVDVWLYGFYFEDNDPMIVTGYYNFDKDIWVSEYVEIDIEHFIPSYWAYPVYLDSKEKIIIPR